MKALIFVCLFFLGCDKTETVYNDVYYPANFQNISFSICDSGIVMTKDNEALLLKLNDDQIHLRLPFHQNPQIIILFDVQSKN